MNRLDIRNDFSIFILFLLYTIPRGRILCPDLRKGCVCEKGWFDEYTDRVSGHRPGWHGPQH